MSGRKPEEGSRDEAGDFYSHNFKKPEERIDISPCGTEGCWWIEDFSWLEQTDDKE